MDRRHPDVDQHQLGCRVANQFEQLRAVAGRPATAKPERSSRLARPARSRRSSSAMTTRSPVVAEPSSSSLGRFGAGYAMVIAEIPARWYGTAHYDR